MSRSQPQLRLNQLAAAGVTQHFFPPSLSRSRLQPQLGPNTAASLQQQLRLNIEIAASTRASLQLDACEGRVERIVIRILSEVRRCIRQDRVCR